MPFYLAIKNIFSRKTSFGIILFISFSISLLFVSNAFFDKTGKGIEKTFVNSFTGDVVIRPKVDFPLSLLGDETPATGSFSEIPQIIPYLPIFEKVSQFKEINTVLPQISGTAVININGNHIVCVPFGVDSEAYIQNMPGIHIIEGRFYLQSEKGVMLSEFMIDDIYHNTGVKYRVGDSIQFLSGNGISYSLRTLLLTGIYSYEIENEILKKICLVSPEVVREFSGVKDTSEINYEIKNDQNDLIQNDFDIDDLFSDDTDKDFMVDSEVFENELQVDSDQILNSSTSWNFLVCKVNGNPKKIVKKLNKEFIKNEWNVEAVTWRSAAGLSAMYLFWIHNIFSIGIIILLSVGFIIVTNTLTVSALDRIPETGTLRAIGGKKYFICFQFMAETMMLTFFSGLIGILLGVLFNLLINKLNISFTNTYLIQIFGGTTLKSEITLSNVFRCFILSIFLGIIGWIYPVKISLDVTPLNAMQRGV